MQRSARRDRARPLAHEEVRRARKHAGNETGSYRGRDRDVMRKQDHRGRRADHRTDGVEAALKSERSVYELRFRVVDDERVADGAAEAASEPGGHAEGADSEYRV